MTREIQIPTRTLIVLCGTAGAGKSTFARQHFEPMQVVSSDLCRALICDGDRTLNVDPDIFELFHFLIQKRLKLGRFTVADSTALYAFARRQLLDLAHDADYHTCLLVFNVPRSVCLQRDQERARHVGEAEIFTQDALHLTNVQPGERSATNDSGVTRLHSRKRSDAICQCHRRVL
jgi:predicted kinase